MLGLKMYRYLYPVLAPFMSSFWGVVTAVLMLNQKG